MNELPSAGDKLIKRGGSYESTAHTGPWMGNDWMWMAKGYVRAAELAIEECTRADRDFVLYPVVLLCRHSIELALKATLRVGRKTQIQQSSTKPPFGHFLKKLWDELRPILDQQFQGHPPEHIDAVEAIINEFHTIDSSGHTFRYPLDTNGQPNFDKEACICLITFTESTRKVFNFLHGCETSMAANFAGP